MTAVAIAARRRDFGAYVGMVVFLIAWGMTFAALFFSYSVVRTTQMSWPPPGVAPLPIALPAWNTLLLALSSLTFHRGLVAVRAGRERALPAWLGATSLLGVAFLVLQLVVWRRVWQSGLTTDSGIYGSVFYALTVFHGLHVASALITLLYLAPGARRGRYTAARHTAVRMSAMFWHFVDAIWLLMFFSVYVF